jgi:predicted nucleic acid-binding protein
VIQLVDTGPLVAFVNREDRFHAWAAEAFSRIDHPLHTCDAVLTEACFLLRAARGGAEAIVAMAQRGFLRLDFSLAREAASVGGLLRRYADRPMSLADACLVRMTELHTDCELVTLDADFRVYRRNGRQVIPTVMPAK